MSYVKLDCGLLESSLWLFPEQTRVFITALLLARPYLLEVDAVALKVDGLDPDGFVIPAGEYGFARVSPLALVNRAQFLDGPDTGNSLEDGFTALKELCNTDSDSRSEKFGGRRLARVDGGFIVINYMDYRDKDHTATDRKRRQRERDREEMSRRDTVTDRDESHDVTQAKAEAKGSLPYPSQEFAKAWADWEQHRKEKRKKLTPLSISKQFKALSAMGETRAIAAIDYSIEKGWEGIYEEKTNSKSPQKPRRDALGRRVS